MGRRNATAGYYAHHVSRTFTGHWQTRSARSIGRPHTYLAYRASSRAIRISQSSPVGKQTACIPCRPSDRKQCIASRWSDSTSVAFRISVAAWMPFLAARFTMPTTICQSSVPFARFTRSTHFGNPNRSTPHVVFESVSTPSCPDIVTCLHALMCLQDSFVADGDATSLRCRHDVAPSRRATRVTPLKVYKVRPTPPVFGTVTPVPNRYRCADCGNTCCFETTPANAQDPADCALTRPPSP